MPSSAELSSIVKKLSNETGFSYCGIAKAQFLEEEAQKLESWLAKGYQGKMSYLENHFEKRLDPTKLVPGAKSVISLVYNYYPQYNEIDGNSYKVAKYAWGRDYHKVVKSKLKSLVAKIEENIGTKLDGRIFVDSAPVMERQWAAKAGNGWIGKNGLLLNRFSGSFFFLAEIISDLELEEDGPIKDYCGSCRRCMDACPTDAFPEPYVLDASKCISYLTIELKDQIPSAFDGQMVDWIFGCDICQDVCPWNRFSSSHDEEQFNPRDFLSSADKKSWEELTEEIFEKHFKASPLKRAGFEKIKKSIAFQKEKPVGETGSK